MKFEKVFVIVLDSLGIGNAKDAAMYHDEGSNTFGNIAKNYSLNIPNLLNLGIRELVPHLKDSKPLAVVAALNEQSVGKDTLTGHYELMGLKISNPFKTFTDTGFPKELIDELETKTSYKFIGNIAASGTEIIEELGETADKEAKIIIYTSSDSVLQLAANEDVIGLDNLYKVCEIARNITLKDEYLVGRIIARPYKKDNSGKYYRTTNRHDYALPPPSTTYLDILKEHKFDVISVGKINDIFNGFGITRAIKSPTNDIGMNETIKLLDEKFTGLCFTNLVDFDMLYGHRRDITGYAKAIERFDVQLGVFLSKMSDKDLLILTADHGNDPTYSGTDHTREQVFALLYHKNIKSLKINSPGNFSDIGATVVESLGIKATLLGKNLLN